MTLGTCPVGCILLHILFQGLDLSPALGLVSCYPPQGAPWKEKEGRLGRACSCSQTFS